MLFKYIIINISRYILITIIFIFLYWFFTEIFLYYLVDSWSTQFLSNALSFIFILIINPIISILLADKIYDNKID
jgi:multisubunit Na+/H+ antiporter MnhG subunit